MSSNSTKKKTGRPPKAVIESKKAGNRGVRGRPPGDAAAINEFKARLLASPKSRKVMDSILNAALDDDHKNQAAAWKLLMDRMLPLSYFDKDKVGGGKSAISITISGVGETSLVGETIVSTAGDEDEAIEAEYTKQDD